MTSPSLSQKLLSLAANLRENGFEKYAQVLENQLVSIHKTAAHLYQTHDETGDDVINFAHRDGDKELEKSWGELGEVETILSRHNKILDVVHKEPSIKKKANKNLLNAVRIILAESNDTSTDEQIKAIVNEGISYISSFIDNLINLQNKKIKTEGTGIVLQSTLEDMQDDLSKAKELAPDATNYNTVMKITKLLTDDFPNDFYDSSNTGGYLIDKDVVDQMKQYVDTAKSRFNAAFQLLQGHIEGAQFQLQQGIEPSKISLLNGSSTPTASSSLAPQTKFMDDANIYLKSINSWKQTINSDPDNTLDDKKAAGGWLDKKEASIRSLVQQFYVLPNEQKEKMSQEYEQKLSSLVTAFPQFKQKWIGND